ncbi:acetyltransferase [Roseicyclus marinus]|uniref:acetyltransferase n=1 Tax=Roseicyclus marinus TaxID=2161673 RepID=UPI00240F7CE1|nr:acetyltransferase [Roseicyclus marinus]MDG3042443.1 acetyltransferase [Roseicyclus marinus]
MNALRIIGAGGHGRVLADIAEGMGYREISFLDAGYPKLHESGAWPVTGRPEAQDEADVALGIGDNATRLSFFETLTQTPVTLIHPSAVVSPHAEIGAGSVICAGAVVAPFAKLGQGCIINTCASVDHDCVLSDGVHISPGARLGGGVFVGARTWIGIGAVVREYKSIGSDVMVGAGAAVTRNVGDGARIGGVPAKEF